MSHALSSTSSAKQDQGFDPWQHAFIKIDGEHVIVCPASVADGLEPEDVKSLARSVGLQIWHSEAGAALSDAHVGGFGLSHGLVEVVAERLGSKRVAEGSVCIVYKLAGAWECKAVSLAKLRGKQLNPLLAIGLVLGVALLAWAGATFLGSLIIG